ncbi:hypothetical protein HRR83_004082 [Exophiala dermatitidis]|uniref:Uncharacterized protein n=1 Tax=Exophiala dermatitidis TaxID=5970 RepID=A0AAN6ET95_EXODE|nr:hypothetical protein HRR73_007725 [Exophiala dermatitidis]KAJ4521613.1 hypothetical protein HRR74_003438 [Exophiala dermatitidis]KAJ4533303.1 hypothetical protein HRR77_008653 [Exophiala dermatitidis]KAJ4555051.1 hypothetical protein HRR79_009161 [Exophiala dermatitidis]KAJ4562704.1 hypothetical protein HRR81_008728 [Exophiala dermatitidis]
MASLRRLVLAVALFGISSVACLGTAAIENRCDVEVYIWSIANVPNDTINYLEPNIGSYNETYRVNPNGGGISLKIATVPDDSFITQFEYTYHPENPILAYDISNINGYPFENWGLYLSPSSGDCSSVTCDPGVALCPDVYNQPNDDFAVKSCDVSANLTLTLCPPQTTSLETATVTVTTTDSAGDAILTTLATTITSVGPVTTSQGAVPETVTVDTESSSTTTTTTTALEPVVVTLMTTDTAGDPILTTLTTTITSVGPVVTSQDTASEIVTTDPATASMVTISSETILRASETTDAAGQLSLTTLTTVIAVTTLD